MSLVKEIKATQSELVSWRHEIHAHPELGFDEHTTAEFVAEKLQSFGIEVSRGIGKTGLVGVLRQGNETRSIGLRADMDALPIHEQNTFTHRSTKEGCMHACGHDGHTIMLLAAARHLAETRNFRGQVNFIFQPAEEGIGGARAMIEDRLFEQFPCDSLYAMHNGPGLAVGKFITSPGIRTAAGAFFDIQITGKGGHGAHPDKTVDPVVIAAELVVALQTVVSRSVPPSETAVLSVTQMHAGDAYNVIPGSAKLSGTVRTLSLKLLSKIETRMATLAEGISLAHGGEAQLDFRTIFHPVINDESATGLAAEVCDVMVGAENVIREAPPSTGSEDFSFMSEQVPGCYVILGNGRDSAPLHNHHYDFNDDALVYGASFFTRIVERSLLDESA